MAIVVKTCCSFVLVHQKGIHGVSKQNMYEYNQKKKLVTMLIMSDFTSFG